MLVQLYEAQYRYTSLMPESVMFERGGYWERQLSEV